MFNLAALQSPNGYHPGYHRGFLARQLPVLNKRRVSCQNLVAYWKLDETSGEALDATGRGNTLTPVNNPVAEYGILGNSRLFVAASTQYLTRGTNGSDDLTLGDTNWTITCWVYLNSAASTQLVVTKHLNPTSGEFAIMLVNRYPWFLLYGANNSDSGVIVSTTQLALSTWYFLAVRHNASANQMTLTLGASHTTIATLGPVAATTNSFRLGAQQSAGFYLDGRVDEVGVWKRLLSNAELSLLN